MAQKKHLLTDISLKGLEIAPSQIRGAVRIVPLLRHNIRDDLRLLKRSYDEDLTVVSVEKDINYYSYVPHGLVMSWTDDGSPVAALGGQIDKLKTNQSKINQSKSNDKQINCGYSSVRLMHRMRKRESKNQLRFLPLHLAMEGFLSMFFNGPNIAWSEYSKYAISHGLGCRYETAVKGLFISRLEDASRVFEIHPQQVGALIFVAEALASAFVVPTPEDYRLLHKSLLEDFYGELIYQYGLLYDTTFPMDVSIDESEINSLKTLRLAIDKMRMDWADFQGFMASGILGRKLQSKIVYNAGPFRLQRFITDIQLKEENHIGEAIVRENGEVEYLKTFRLSKAQTKRVYLLTKLAEHNWNLSATAQALGNNYDEFVHRLEKSGFGYLLNQQVREQVAKRRRKK